MHTLRKTVNDQCARRNIQLDAQQLGEPRTLHKLQRKDFKVPRDSGICFPRVSSQTSLVRCNGIGPINTVQWKHSLLLKYADDIYLNIPTVNTSTVQEELNHIADWSSANI